MNLKDATGASFRAERPLPRRVAMVLAFLVSLVIAACAVALRWALDPYLGEHVPLVTLFGAVAAAVWLGGWAPAVMVTILGYLACDILFIEPRGVVGLTNARSIVGAGTYLFTCVIIIAFGEALRRARAQASARRESLRVTLASIGDAVITTDTAGHVTYINSVAEQLTGWTLREAEGQPLETVFRVVNEDTRAGVDNPAARALREGTVVGLANHTILIAKDGTERPIDDSAAPIRDSEGNVGGCVLIFRDVSERRNTEIALKASQEMRARLAAIVADSDDAIVSKTLDGVIQSWNAGAERLFGYSSDEAVGQSIDLIIPKELREEEQQILQRLRRGERLEHFETIRVTKDGRRVNISLTVSPVRDAAGQVIGASKVARNITERTIAELQLRESEQRFRTIADSTPLLMWQNDMTGCVFVNRAYLDFLGLQFTTDVAGYDWSQYVHPDDREGYVTAYKASLATCTPFEATFRFRRHDGAYRWMQSVGVPRTGPDGVLLGYTGCSYDIHDARQASEALREADRRKDEFLATLAHELRNPLAPLVNMLEIMKRADGRPDLLAQVRGTMGRQLSSLVRLVDDLLDVGRITRDRLELRKERVELAAVVQHAVESCRPLIDGLRHQVEVSLPPEPVELHGDPVRLAQIFHNLLNNACKYTQPGGRIFVVAEREDSGVVVKVRDTGVGIPADKLSAIFDMFMQVDPSLERSQGGLGIGLTLVKRLVELHGGTVEAFSDGPGKGSEFVVHLPAFADMPETQRQAAPDARRASPSRRILVVDDNADAARSLAMLLELSGNQVRTAHDGLQAITAAEEYRPDVVLLDIGMPKMNGVDAARHIRAQAWGKDMILIALTGWGQEADRRRSQEAGFNAHMVKPVDHADLAEILSSLSPGEAPAAASGRPT